MIYLESSIRIVLIEFTLIALLNILMIVISKSISSHLKEYSKTFEILHSLFILVFNGFAILWKMSIELGMTYKLLLFIIVVLFNLSPSHLTKNFNKTNQAINSVLNRNFDIIYKWILFYLAAILSVFVSLYLGSSVEYGDEKRYTDILAFCLLLGLSRYIFKIDSTESF